MTLPVYREFVQDAFRSLDTLSRETTGAIDEKLIRPRDGQAVQTLASLMRFVCEETLANAVEVGRGGHHDLDVATPAASLREREKQSPSPGSDETLPLGKKR